MRNVDVVAASIGRKAERDIAARVAWNGGKIAARFERRLESPFR
jgi:hypothetical protein